MEQYNRTARLIGEAGVACLKQKAVAVFGLGGVGSYAAEALARAGVGKLLLVDCDRVQESNINRQLYALHSTVGKLKTEVAAARIADIDPTVTVETQPLFYSADTADHIDLSRYDYVIDAIDTVTAKLLLIERCKAANVPIISCMGTGNHLDASRFHIVPIEKTNTCPLARVMRYELKKRGITGVKVLFSDEPPRLPLRGSCRRMATEGVDEENTPSDTHTRATSLNEGGCGPRTPASISFVPSVAGLLLAGEAVRELLT